MWGLIGHIGIKSFFACFKEFFSKILRMDRGEGGIDVILILPNQPCYDEPCLDNLSGPQMLIIIGFGYI